MQRALVDTWDLGTKKAPVPTGALSVPVNLSMD